MIVDVFDMCGQMKQTSTKLKFAKRSFDPGFVVWGSVRYYGKTSLTIVLIKFSSQFSYVSWTRKGNDVYQDLASNQAAKKTIYILSMSSCSISLGMGILTQPCFRLSILWGFRYLNGALPC